MCFRIADIKTLLVTGLICGLLSAAKAQSNGGGQRILFSAPDGQITSNAPLPMAEAPQPREALNLPDNDSPAPQFSGPPGPPVIFAEPPPVFQPDAARRGNDSLDPMNIRKQMDALTPRQIMNVPTPEQIFGLAEKGPEAQKTPVHSRNGDVTGDTNFLASATTALIQEPKWVRGWFGDTGDRAGSSNSTDRATSFFSGFFDSARNGNGFGKHDANDSDMGFGPSQPAAQPSAWDSAFSGSGMTPSAPATELPANNFTMRVAPASLGFGSQSPFALPQVSRLGNLPRLPAVPSLPGQNNQFDQLPTAPSVAPQPPPWTTLRTPFGTPVQLNQNR